MTIAYDPKPSPWQIQGNRNDSSIREITDETVYENEPEEEPGKRSDWEEDWRKIYSAGKMEENY